MRAITYICPHDPSSVIVHWPIYWINIKTGYEYPYYVVDCPWYIPENIYKPIRKKNLSYRKIARIMGYNPPAAPPKAIAHIMGLR